MKTAPSLIESHIHLVVPRALLLSLCVCTVLCASGCSAPRRVGGSLSSMRAELIRLNEEQIIDNAIRLKWGGVPVHVNYTSIRGCGAWKVGAGAVAGNETTLSLQNSVLTGTEGRDSYLGNVSAELTGQLEVTGAPVVGTAAVNLLTWYEALEASITGPFLTSDPRVTGRPANACFRLFAPRPAMTSREWDQAAAQSGDARHAKTGMVVYCVEAANQEAFKTNLTRIALLFSLTR